MENLNPLKSITPIDGRYREKLEKLEEYFSEYAFIKERLIIEVEYLVKFLEEVEPSILKNLPENWKQILDNIIIEFDLREAEKIKEVERRVGHDVVAITIYLREKLRQIGLEDITRFIHFGLTSEDVNNIAYSTLLRKFNREVFIPMIMNFLDKLENLVLEHISTVMVSRTHGVPAVPTTLGRFLANYLYRVARISVDIASTIFPAKIGGAVGDLNALTLTYPNIDWHSFIESFIKSRGLEYFPASTQILPHDENSKYFSKIAILNSIISNFCRDLWFLSLLGYVSFHPLESEIHSSTMPHKSNPTLLENAEGALDLASNILSYMSTRLISSRLHRDLSDSVIKRFYGLPLSLTILGLINLCLALDRVRINKDKIEKDLKEYPEVLAEAYQVVLRKKGVTEAYEIVRHTLREEKKDVINRLRKIIPADLLDELEKISLENYIGKAVEITFKLLEKTRELKETMLKKIDVK
ncbi:MAG: lyase family protein [Nitrososphaerota archaeon]